MSQSKTSKEAMEAFDNAKAHDSAVPGEHGDHSRSHAAHLENEGHVSTIPEGYGKQGREAGTLKEPPQDPSRSGKTHHRQ